MSAFIDRSALSNCAHNAGMVVMYIVFIHAMVETIAALSPRNPVTFKAISAPSSAGYFARNEPTAPTTFMIAENPAINDALFLSSHMTMLARALPIF